MDFSKLPPSLLVALGLTTAGCTRVTTCLSIAETEGDTGTDTDPDTSTSACLSPLTDTSATEFTTGPCLTAPQTTSSTGPDTDTDTDTDSGTTVGPCLEPPLTTSGPDTDTDTDGTTGGSTSARAPSRARVLEKLASEGILPPDITRRLRRNAEEA
jgi:hypothetical protein